MSIAIPESLATSCAKTLERRDWLSGLPGVIDDISFRWSLSLGAPFGGEDVSCSWVAPATRADGTSVIVKVGMPHMEAENEIGALRLLDGDPTVQLIEADESHNAMLLERCEPGTSLRELFQADQDVVIAGLLKRFWRIPPPDNRFRPLSAMITHWTRESLAHEAEWYDAALVKKGLDTFEWLISTSMSEVLLATDLHAGNVLAAEREPWLVIDPKPFLGDRAYDATQHLLNCRSRLATDATGTIRRIADLLETDYDRVRLWLFARLAAEPRDEWDDDATALARAIARE